MARPLFHSRGTDRSYDGLQFRQKPLSPPDPSPNADNTTFLLLVFGKAEDENNECHGHVTAITVAPEYRRLGLARKMMGLLELVSDEIYRGYFVDLYVRCTNTVAIEMYEGLGYSVWRRVREYYGSLGLGKASKDEEDAFGL
jgi:N-terminal acetyltransferase B complex catalytic subunit